MYGYTKENMINDKSQDYEAATAVSYYERIIKVSLIDTLVTYEHTSLYAINKRRVWPLPL